jgi:uncharacterized membrane protein
MRRIIFSLIFILFSSVFVAVAQDKQPQARIRIFDNCQSADKCYAIEIYMPESLSESAYTALVSRDENVIKPTIAVIFNSTIMSQYKVQISEKDSRLAPERRGRLFVMYLPQTFPVKKPSQLVFLNYPSANGDLIFPSGTIGSDFKTTFEFNDFNKLFTQRIVLKKDPFDCEDADVPCKDDVQRLNVCQSATDGLCYANYIKGRKTVLENFYASVNKHEVNLRAENLNKCYVIVTPTNEKKGCITNDEWSDLANNIKEPKFSLRLTFQELTDIRNYLLKEGASNIPTAPMNPPIPADRDIYKALIEYRSEKRNKFVAKKNITIQDLTPFTISNIATKSPTANNSSPNPLTADDTLLVDISTKETLPGKFNIHLEYTSANVPFEVAKTFKKTDVEISRVTVNSSADTGNVGERDLPDNLDIAVLFGSSVVEKEEEVNGVATTVRKRETRATFDVRFQPFNAEPIIKDSNFIEWTPVYLDAKVSTGKIDKDTLSLNRVVLGTKFDFTNYYPFNTRRVGTNPDYLNFNAQFVQASDRDFRQLEYKGVFEFVPRLAFLNQIPVNNKNWINKAISAPDDEIPFREVQPSRGYKIQPVVGGEIGKTWFRRRPASAIEPTDYIRRLFVGLDMTFYLSKSASLTFTDKYYFSFGKNVDKKENYFKAVLDFGSRKKNGFGDSFFISFEKGNQPPFNTPDVNAFKIGYRFVNPRFRLF